MCIDLSKILQLKCARFHPHHNLLYISEVHAAVLIAYGGELVFYLNFTELFQGFLQLMLNVDITSPKCDVRPTSLPVCASTIAKIHVLLVTINDIQFLSSILHHLLIN